MQEVGPSPHSCSSTSDCFPLSHVNEVECGSETSAEPEKHEVRVNSKVSVCQRLTRGDHEFEQCSRVGIKCVNYQVLSEAVAVDKRPDLATMRPIVSFYLWYLLCLCLGLACVVCVCVWNQRWRGGFAWDGSSLEFNWHPVLMVTGLVVLYGNGAVVYRVPLTWGQNKLPWKLLHAALMLVSLVMAVVGLCAVFDNHNAHNIANLYSLHSWIGLSATALFAMQWAVGMAGFLLPCSPIALRKLLKPIHVWMGVGILSLSIAACISGINEKLFFVLKGTNNATQPYSKSPPEALLGNSLGVLIVAFGLVVLRILSKYEWQRPDSRPEDMTYTPLLQEENE